MSSFVRIAIRKTECVIFGFYRSRQMASLHASHVATEKKNFDWKIPKRKKIKYTKLVCFSSWKIHLYRMGFIPLTLFWRLPFQLAIFCASSNFANCSFNLIFVDSFWIGVHRNYIESWILRKMFIFFYFRCCRFGHVITIFDNPQWTLFANWKIWRINWQLRHSFHFADSLKTIRLFGSTITKSLADLWWWT